MCHWALLIVVVFTIIPLLKESDVTNSASCLVDCVIVDGDKKEEISPLKHQKHDVKSFIDSYNVKTCGISDPNFEEREFVNMARAGQFPWIVSFQIKLSEVKMAHRSYDDLHFCSGTFISNKWILSAAHCFASESIRDYLKQNKLKVVAGSHYVSSGSPVNRNLTIHAVYYHKRFSSQVPIGFDIALVELQEPVRFSLRRVQNSHGDQVESFYNAACLPLNSHTYDFNETARIAGWGLSSHEDPSSMPKKLLTTDILLANSSDCANRYAAALHSLKPRHQLEKYNDFICASYHNTRDACQSDSGAPLMQYVERKAVVVGIVSYGIGCAKTSVPGVYTRTSAYINWIKDITERGPGARVEFSLLTSNSTDQKSQAN